MVLSHASETTVAGKATMYLQVHLCGLYVSCKSLRLAHGLSREQTGSRIDADGGDQVQATIRLLEQHAKASTYQRQNVLKHANTIEDSEQLTDVYLLAHACEDA